MTGRPKKGDRLEAALWYNPLHPQEIASAKDGIRKAVQSIAEQYQLIVGPVEWTDFAPGDARIPDPPPHMPRGVRLMLGEAEVLAQIEAPAAPKPFVDDLERVDLVRLRTITRDAYARNYPDAPALTDAQCDEVIEQIGPESAMRAVRASVDSGSVH